MRLRSRHLFAAAVLSLSALVSCDHAPTSDPASDSPSDPAPIFAHDAQGTMTLRATVHSFPGFREEDFRVRSVAHGVEDSVTLRDSARSSMTYDLGLDAKTAALRLVENQLEIVDRAGFPRIRVRSPVVRDALGRRSIATMSIEGCAVDSYPAPPFRRRLPSPGARTCILRLSWRAENLRFPIVVDPTWETTEAMAVPRYGHIAATLPSGDVLVAGGLIGDPATTESATSSVEIYSGGTWAAGASMLEPRTLQAAAPLANGDLLVSGGLNQDDMGQTILGTAEIYSVTAHTWTATGSLGTPRSGHTATPVGDGSILIAGGYDNSGTHFSNAELYSAGTFSAAGSINTSRFYHAAVELSGNRVLLGGGTDPFTGAIGSLELYTAGVGWSAPQNLAPMATRRTLMTGTLLADGKVVFAGGYNSDDGALASAETYDPQANTWSTASGNLSHARYDAVATSLADGRVLIAGGEDLTGDFSDGEIYDPATTTFTDVCGGAQFRAFGHTASLLASGAVLVAGGYDYFPSRILATADLFDDGADGGIDDAGTCRQSAPDAGAPVDAGLDAGADASTMADAGSISDSGVDASKDGGATEDAGSRDVGGGGTADDEIFSAAGGCNASSGLGDGFGWISAVFAFIAGSRRRRRSA